MSIDVGIDTDGRDYHADLCVVGSGAAGITLAIAAAARGMRVLLVAGGDIARQPELDALYEAEVSGLPYAVEQSRLNQFGGSTGHWGGWCTPLSPEDYEARAWRPGSGWPLRPHDLAPYYEAAHDVLDLGRPRYDAAYWARRLARRPWPGFSDRSAFRHAVWQVNGPTHLGAKYGAAIAGSARIHALLGVTALEIASRAGIQAVAHVLLGTLDGRRARAFARSYVVAVGGMETPRLLLLSRGAEPNGVGNAHGLVGRGFTEHPSVWRMATMYAPRALTRDMPFEAPAERLLRRRGLLERQPRAVAFGIAPSRPLQEAERLPQVWIVPQGAGNAASGEIETAAALLGVAPGALSAITLAASVECGSHPDSRVTLGGRSDAFGRPLLRLHWLVQQDDRAGLWRTLELLGDRLRAAGAMLRMREDPRDPAWTPLGGPHHMSTARMAADPRRGVVDTDLRVHGYPDLYVCGSAVFPTAGFGTPTLTVVALTLRLADHLASQMRARAG